MSDEEKKFNKAGCIAVIGTLVSLFAGIMMVCYAAILGVHGLLIAGIILVILPFIIIPILTMLPARLRGVEEVPRKERIIQMLMMLFLVMLLAGFVTAIVMGMSISEEDSDNALPFIISGGAAAVGFVGVFVMAFVNKHVTGKDSMTIRLFPEDEKSREVTENVLDKVLKPENRLSAEERERELERIEKNTVGAMTKEQVEEYENKKHLF